MQLADQLRRSGRKRPVILCAANLNAYKRRFADHHSCVDGGAYY
jgi:hypothetical protein